MSIKSKIDELTNSFISDYKSLKNERGNPTSLINKYLGRKGLINELYKLLGSEKVEEKSNLGKLINDFKELITSKLYELNLEHNSDSIPSVSDLSLPESYQSLGSIHPITIIIDEIKNIFSKIGFSSIYGPEVDLDYYNFEALNIPPHHPARDMQDTFYINKNLLLRTHTSGSQIHFMENN